jgi:hypothetical protein
VASQAYIPFARSFRARDTEKTNKDKHMKRIDNTIGLDRAVSALLGKAATLVGGVTMKLFGRSSGPSPRRRRKPVQGKRDQRALLVKGGLTHA